jgi:protein-S-isoprenylcysteine O-methyltransferase Ste14
MSKSEPSQLKIIAPPPVLYAGAFVLGCVIHLYSPLRIFHAASVHWIAGTVVLALSASIARWSFLTMRQFGTTANPRKTSEALATSGPFRFSRNPIYVAMTGLYLGLAFVLDSAWPMMLLAPLLLLMDWGVVQREERYLSERFGDAYAAYKSRVRRWL